MCAPSALAALANCACALAIMSQSQAQGDVHEVGSSSSVSVLDTVQDRAFRSNHNCSFALMLCRALFAAESARMAAPFMTDGAL
jgi:hypothetical protein